MTKELRWEEAIKKVLSESPHPLHYMEIRKKIISDGLRTKLGATPAFHVNSKINSSIRNQGNSSPYVKVDRAVYTLRDKSYSDQKAEVAETEFEEEDSQGRIISSFGVFWRREAVDWSSVPKLFGMRNIKADPVDFTKQKGIYLLYDGREIIYVGRTTGRPLAHRLYEHTKDRLATRWDRFSWFGLMPVLEDGRLAELPSEFNFDKLIPALEAILIEALEPRQNRRRGDDLEDVEFIQFI